MIVARTGTFTFILENNREQILVVFSEDFRNTISEEKLDEIINSTAVYPSLMELSSSDIIRRARNWRRK
jgi:hypothetical protein